MQPKQNLFQMLHIQLMTYCSTQIKTITKHSNFVLHAVSCTNSQVYALFYIDFVHLCIDLMIVWKHYSLRKKRPKQFEVLTRVPYINHRTHDDIETA